MLYIKHWLYFNPFGYVSCMSLLIIASLSTGNICYLLYIPNGKHINKLITSFQMSSKVYVQGHCWHI